MKKRALCIGINNYPGTHMDLSGCVNDAEDWAGVLSSRGYTTTKLLDSDATKRNMVAAITNLITSAKKGDRLVITYSGHGTYQPDTDGDEVDGYDEALCPYDIQTRGAALTDDEIHDMFNMREAGISLLLISDSCHSGTVTRAVPSPSDAEVLRPRFLPLGNWLPSTRVPRVSRERSLSWLIPGGVSPFRNALVKRRGDVLLAGCEEGPNNYSYDASFNGKPNGAFTYYAIKTLQRMKPESTYADWHKAIRKYLPSASCPQVPQLFGDKRSIGRKIFK